MYFLVSFNLKAHVSLCPYFHSEDNNIYYYNLMMMDKCFLSSISDSLYYELMNGNQTFFVRRVGIDIDGQVICYNIRHNYRYSSVQCDTICHNEFIRYLNTHKSIEWIAAFLINEDALKDNNKLKQLALQSFTGTSLLSINYIFPRKAYVFYPSLKKYWETHIIPSKEELLSDVDSMVIKQRNELKTLSEYGIDEDEIKKTIRKQQLKQGRLLQYSLSPDPMSYKAPHLSPFAHCANNPLNLLDPSGMDEWYINKNGQVVQQIATNQHDAFFILNNQSEIENASPMMIYGTVKGIEYLKAQGGEPYLKFSIAGDKAGKEIFEFLANNTDVEWSQLKTSASTLGENYISTTMNYKIEQGAVSILYDQLLPSNILVREFTHSHPNNSPIPSTCDPDGTDKTSEGDLGFAKRLHSVYGDIVKFNIFTKEDGYSPYDINYKNIGFGIFIDDDFLSPKIIH